MHNSTNNSFMIQTYILYNFMYLSLALTQQLLFGIKSINHKIHVYFCDTYCYNGEDQMKLLISGIFLITLNIMAFDFPLESHHYQLANSQLYPVLSFQTAWGFGLTFTCMKFFIFSVNLCSLNNSFLL